MAQHHSPAVRRSQQRLASAAALAARTGSRLKLVNATEPRSTAPKTDPGRVDLRARNVLFSWAETPLHWMPLEPIASHFLSSLSLLLPEGERMFCATFTEALPLIRDERLRRDVLGFIGQESMHAEMHDSVVEEFLTEHGIDAHRFVAHAEFLFRKVLGPRPHLTEKQQKQYLVDRLAVISGLEHLFAFLGDWVINADLESFEADPRMLDLYRWHGAEEVEHRMVAHEVADYFEIGYVRRNVAMVIGCSLLVALLLRGTRFLVNEDESLPNMNYLEILRETVGTMSRGALPTFGKIGRSVITCLHPSYSPTRVGNTAQALAYLAKSPAARAASA